MLVLNFLSAQPYNFAKYSGTYTELTSPNIVSLTTPWTPFQSHTVPIGFNFVFYSQSFSTIYIEGSGFSRFDAGYMYLINPFTVAMQDAGTGSPLSASPLSYELIGSNPFRILKIEWKNCELVDDTGSFANFQLWLFESTNAIEVHIGNCTINNPSMAFQGNATDGPVVAIFDLIQSVGKAVNGTPPTEIGATLSSITSPFDYSMVGVPTNGTIYSFTMPMGVDQYEVDGVEMYPNPVVNETRLTIGYPVPYKLKNAFGHILQQGILDKVVNIEAMSPGIYFLEFCINGKYYSKKLIKQ